jgi:hypothetical protein
VSEIIWWQINSGLKLRKTPTQKREGASPPNKTPTGTVPICRDSAEGRLYLSPFSYCFAGKKALDLRFHGRYNSLVFAHSFIALATRSLLFGHEN